MANSNPTQQLFEKGLLNQDQKVAIESHRNLNLFSIRSEVLFLLFVAVSMFTAGMGILIYKNIDTIGHLAILILIFAAAAFCFYTCFKNAPGFSKGELTNSKPLYDYLLLVANLLSGIFIGYLQFQYTAFGSHNDLATLIPTLLYLGSAYYFDHKGVLALGVSGLCAFVGFSASPSGVLNNEFSGSSSLAYYAMVLGLGLILWAKYSQKTGLKQHFSVTYHNFSMHIVGLAAISQLFEPYWFFPLAILAVSVYYFTIFSYKLRSAYFMTFSFLYAFVGVTSLIIHLIEYLDVGALVVYLSPFYLIAVIVYFTRSLKALKNRSADESV